MSNPKIEQRLVADLIPYAANSRTHSDAQVAQIAASIKEFGWTSPILIDGDNTIIAGHGRLLAARKLGMEEVPAIILDHLSKPQQRALVIADNQLALNAAWDMDMLKAEIEGLSDSFDLDILGFSEIDLEKLINGLDYSLLDEDDLDGQLDEMARDVKKAIQIEFEAEYYAEAQALVQFWRSRGGNVGMMLIEKLKAEKEKL
jgi:ParB-like chromosome segregation protein Spo0J